MRGSQGGGERKERQREPPGIIVPSGCFETAAAAAAAGNAAALGACQRYQAPSLAGCPCPAPWALRPHPALPRTCQQRPLQSADRLGGTQASAGGDNGAIVGHAERLRAPRRRGSRAAMPRVPAADARARAHEGEGRREQKRNTPLHRARMQSVTPVACGRTEGEWRAPCGRGAAERHGAHGHRGPCTTGGFALRSCSGTYPGTGRGGGAGRRWGKDRRGKVSAAAQVRVGAACARTPARAGRAQVCPVSVSRANHLGASRECSRWSRTVSPLPSAPNGRLQPPGPLQWSLLPIFSHSPLARVDPFLT